MTTCAALRRRRLGNDVLRRRPGRQEPAQCAEQAIAQQRHADGGADEQANQGRKPGRRAAVVGATSTAMRARRQATFGHRRSRGGLFVLEYRAAPRAGVASSGATVRGAAALDRRCIDQRGLGNEAQPSSVARLPRRVPVSLQRAETAAAGATGAGAGARFAGRRRRRGWRLLERE